MDRSCGFTYVANVSKVWYRMQTLQCRDTKDTVCASLTVLEEDDNHNNQWRTKVFCGVKVSFFASRPTTPCSLLPPPPIDSGYCGLDTPRSHCSKVGPHLGTLVPMGTKMSFLVPIWSQFIFKVPIFSISDLRTRQKSVQPLSNVNHEITCGNKN